MEMGSWLADGLASLFQVAILIQAGPGAGRIVPLSRMTRSSLVSSVSALHIISF